MHPPAMHPPVIAAAVMPAVMVNVRPHQENSGSARSPRFLNGRSSPAPSPAARPAVLWWRLSERLACFLRSRAPGVPCGPDLFPVFLGLFLSPS